MSEMIVVGATAILLSALAFIALKLRRRFQHLDKQLAGLSSHVGDRVVAKLDEKTRELQNTIALSQMGFCFPLFLGGWSIDAFLGVPDLFVGVRHANLPQGSHAVTGNGRVQLLAQQPRIGRHDGTGRHRTRVFHVVEMPAIRIFSADAMQVGTSAL